MAVIDTTSQSYLAPLARTHSVARVASGIFDRLQDLSDLARSRKALGDLDADQLRDIGLSRAQAQAEAQRALWAVPSSWGSSVDR